MTTVDTILDLAAKATHEGIALESARLCTVCWTVHVKEGCPGCSARQWLYLAPLLHGFDMVEKEPVQVREDKGELRAN